jgi:hypothetical protein
MAAQVIILIFIHHIFILRETKIGIEGWFGWFLVFNAKCNNILVILSKNKNMMYKDQDYDLSSHLYTNAAHTVIRQLEGILLTHGGHLHNLSFH